MNSLPSGTVTFLFTDIEGSTKLAQQYPDAMPVLLTRHHEILREAIQAQNGYIFQNEGDSLAVAFHSPLDALNTAIQAQRLLQGEEWIPAPIKVRMGIHTGAAQLNEPSAPTVYTGYTTLATAARIMSAGHGGQILLSGATRELVRDSLPTDSELFDLGEKRLKDLLRPEHFYQLNLSGLNITFPPLKTLDTFPNNLPIQLTSFIGREQEIDEVKQLLGKTRLVSLTGSGGTGKTRLSLQVGSEILDSFKDGIWFVELAPITDPQLVPNAVASVLGVREESVRLIITTLVDWFSDKELLLILDNCEHLLDACTRFSDSVLHGSRRVSILASSREALGVAGEIAYRVPSLPIPNPKQELNVEQLQECESVRLFIERAIQTLPAFKITNALSPSVTQICRRLDGIPLAIELAAARVKVLSVEQIAERLDDRFRLLTGGSRTALPRQQTLRATIDWSYQLLSEQERLLFRRLAVFVGGWTLEAAEAVCGFGGIEAVDILDLMSHLVDKSLVAVENVGKESRYRRLETIRQYAREKLFETEEAAQMRDRHLDYFKALAEESEIEILNSNQVMWLKRLNDEFDNIRAALEWSQEKRVEDGLRLGSAIWRFCFRYGYMNELFEKLQQLLKQYPETKRTSVRARTLHALSILSVWRGDTVRAYDLAKEGLALCKEIGDQSGEAAALYALGASGTFDGDTNASAHLLQSLALYRALNDSIRISEVLIIVNQASWDVIQRKACLEEALALARARGDAITMAGALDNLGALEMDLKNYSQARSWLEESMTIQQQLGESGYSNTLRRLGTLAIAMENYDAARAYLENASSMDEREGRTDHWTLAWFGHVEVRTGNIEQARAKLMDILYRFTNSNNKAGIIFSMEGLASLAVVLQKFNQASSLYAWTDKARSEMSNPRPAMEQRSVERDLAIIREHLDEAAFNTAYNAGFSMTMNEAIKLATEV